ncbi:MAG: hypothetical protein IH594_13825 [Bacteroidales bacterium]|nr:hypothetical protein [Bacteroidales bacterium]
MQAAITTHGNVLHADVSGLFNYLQAERIIERLFLCATACRYRLFCIDLREMDGSLFLLQETLLSISIGRLYIEHFRKLRHNPLRIAVAFGGRIIFSVPPGVHHFFDGGITLFVAQDIAEAQSWLLTTPTAGGIFIPTSRDNKRNH